MSGQSSIDVCICVAGWHFPEELFRSLKNVSGADIYLLSHQPRENIPGYVYDVLHETRVFIEPNYGYDWGCYQQFLEKGIWRNYRYVVFMHDDLVIKDAGFVEAGKAYLKHCCVVGNHRQCEPRNWPQTHPESYFHVRCHMPDWSFRHEVARGSFFMMTTDALDKVAPFDVFWDRFHIAPYFGNWSLLATCAKFQTCLGATCFDYFSDEHLNSAFITEMVRGQEVEYRVEERTLYRGIMAHWIYVISRRFMIRRMAGKRRNPWEILVERLLQHAGSRPRRSIAGPQTGTQ